MIPGRATAAEAAARAAVERAAGRRDASNFDDAFTRLETSIEQSRATKEVQHLDRLSLTRLEKLQRQWRIYAT